MLMVVVLMVVQLLPLVLREAVNLLPLRMIFTQTFGAVPTLLVVVLALPPAVVRHCQFQAPAPVTPSAAMRELPERFSRIITPTRALAPVFCRALTRATIEPSPLRV